jgi:biopolymer transport protein ExbD
MNGLRVTRRRRPELPLVPLIDVLVMLVLFAFVTMRFEQRTTMNITLPSVQTAGKNSFTGSVTIAIDKSGQIAFNGREIKDEQLPGLLDQVKNVNRDVPILIKGDELSQLKKLTYVMDMCRKAGLNKFSLQMRSPQ